MKRQLYYDTTWNLPDGYEAIYSITNASTGKAAKILLAGEYSVKATVDGAPDGYGPWYITVIVTKTGDTSEDVNPFPPGNDDNGDDNNVDPLSGVDFAKSQYTYRYTGNVIPNPTIKDIPNGYKATYSVFASNGTNAELCNPGQYIVVAAFTADEGYKLPDNYQRRTTVTVSLNAVDPDEPENGSEASSEAPTEGTSEDASEDTSSGTQSPSGKDWVADDGSVVNGDMSDPNWSWDIVEFAAPKIIAKFDGTAKQPQLQYLPSKGYSVHYIIRNGIKAVTNIKTINTYDITAIIIAEDGYAPVPDEYKQHTCTFRITGLDLSSYPTISDILLENEAINLLSLDDEDKIEASVESPASTTNTGSVENKDEDVSDRTSISANGHKDNNNDLEEQKPNESNSVAAENDNNPDSSEKSNSNEDNDIYGNNDSAENSNSNDINNNDTDNSDSDVNSDNTDISLDENSSLSTGDFSDSDDGSTYSDSSDDESDSGTDCNSSDSGDSGGSDSSTDDE